MCSCHVGEMKRSGWTISLSRARNLAKSWAVLNFSDSYRWSRWQEKSFSSAIIAAIREKLAEVCDKKIARDITLRDNRGDYLPGLSPDLMMELKSWMGNLVLPVYIENMI